VAIKPFKEYARKFAHLRRKDEDEDIALRKRASLIRCWEYGIDSWDIGFIKDCVYNAIDAESWQKFRVSMMGQSTRVKLARLEVRYNDLVTAQTLGPHAVAQQRIEKCRIDNYILALVRGGILTPVNHEVIK
jgi:hypothetical protein